MEFMTSENYGKFEILLDKKRAHILIITRESYEEIRNPTFGGSRLINELIKELKSDGKKISIFSLHELDSISSRFLIIKKGRSFQHRYTKLLKNEKLRWFLSLLVSLVGNFFSFVDLNLGSNFEKKIKRIKPDIIMYNGTTGAFTFFRVSKKFNIPFIICEHNVDFYFFSEKLGRFMFPFIFLYKTIEVSTCKKVDGVICFNENDKNILVNEGVSKNNILVWKFKILPQKYDRKTLEGILPAVKKIVGRKLVVCFLGADYTPNVIAVKHIIQIARYFPNVIFLIVGSVGEKFKGMKIPRNVIVTGYVKDVEPYLALSDIFLNLKLTSDTGIEAKMFDYLKYNKPIISTKIGAYGFEDCTNVVIVNTIKEMMNEIHRQVKLVKKWKKSP